jgi:drug/metabolite transporter (DMT)-like permease
MTIVLALGAALLFGAGVALQQDEARALSDRRGLRAGLLVGLAGRPRWLAGLGLDIGGWGLQAWALAVGSLIVVQPLIAINLVFALALAAAFAGQPLARREWLAVAATLVGLVVFLTIGHPTTSSSATAATREWIVLLVVVGGAVVLMSTIGLTRPRTQRAALLGAAAACCEALMAVLSKSFADRLGEGVGATFTSWEPYAIVVGGIVTMVVVQSSYQVGRPTVSLPVNAVTEPVVAVTIGVVLFHEHLHLDPLRAPLIVGAIALMAMGLVALARASAQAEEAAHVPEVSGT